jgi:23S rRNA G2445 N2-methylase RlmL
MKAYYSNRQKELLRDRRDEHIAAGQWDATDDRCWDRLADDFTKAHDAGIVERRSNVENWPNARSCAAKNWRRKGLD